MAAVCGSSKEPLTQHADPTTVGFQDLTEHIAIGRTSALNNDTSTNVETLFANATGLLLSDEDVDEQLLIKVPFKDAVKLRGIEFHSEASNGERSAPKTVRVFINNDNLDFSDADSAKADDQFELTSEDIGKEMKVKFVKFQNVNSLTLFVVDNQGDTDVTALTGLKFIGAPKAGMDCSKIEKKG